MSSPARDGSGAVVVEAPSKREVTGDRLSRSAPLVVLGLLAALAAGYVQQIGWQTSTFTNDELYGLVGGRFLERDFFGFITDRGYFNRGPERLVSLLQVPPNALFASVGDELRAIHVLLAVMYFSTVAPAYLLARGVGLDRWPAVLASALVILTPWIVFGGTLLNVTLGLPATTLFAYLAWRAAMRPSLAGDALVLAAALLNTLTRTGHAPFTVVAVIAVVYAVWLRRPAGEPARRALLHLPLRVARTHPLLVAVSLLAAVVVIRLGITTVVGSAYASNSSVTLPWDSLWFHVRDWFMQLTMATGYLPVIIGAPWLLWQVVRPARPETGVFAVVTLGLFFVFVYITSTHNSVSEERYVAVFAALPVIAFCAALYRREAWPLGTLLVGLLAARAIATLGPFVVNAEGYAPYQIGPARRFFEEALVGRATAILPGADTNVVLVVTLTIVLGAVAAAFLASPSAARLPRTGARQTTVATAASAGVLLFGLVGLAWTVDRYRETLPQPRAIDPMTWVDQETGGGRTFTWSHFGDETRAVNLFLGLQTVYFNTSACCQVWLNDVQNLLGRDGELPGGATPYIVRPAGYVPLAFDTSPVARRQFGATALRLDRFDGPPKAALRVRGAAPTGALPAAGQAALGLFSMARGAGRCVSVEMIAPVDRAGAYRLTAGSASRMGRLRPFERRVERVRTTGLDAIKIRRRSGPVSIGEIAVSRCS